MVFRACAMQTECLTCKILAQAFMFAAALHFGLDCPLLHNILFHQGHIFSCVSIWELFNLQQNHGQLIIAISIMAGNGEISMLIEVHISDVRDTVVAFSIWALAFSLLLYILKPPFYLKPKEHNKKVMVMEYSYSPGWEYAGRVQGMDEPPETLILNHCKSLRVTVTRLENCCKPSTSI